MAIIYKIYNSISGKCYVGETIKDITSRWKGHLNSIKRNSGCPALKDAINKYGVDVFKISVLIICFDEDRYNYEKEYIKKYNSVVPNGYNILEGGEGGGFKGKKHTQETKDKIRKILKDKYKNPELRLESARRTIEAFKANNINISERMKNSHKWNEHVKKLRLNSTASKNPNARIKFKIKTYDKNNNFLNEYETMAEASRDTGISLSSIKYNLKRNTCGAYGILFKRILI